MFIRTCVTLLFVLLTTCLARAWDPWGDINNPGRILRNAEREIRAAADAAKRAQSELLVQQLSPVLEKWLSESRNGALNGAKSIPASIRERLSGFYPEDILDRVRYKVGDPGTINLSALSITYGGAAAVTLGEVVVFANEGDAMNHVSLWAHELKHVEQFKNWGVGDFAKRYLRDWSAVESEAYDAQRKFARFANTRPIYADLDGNGQLDKITLKPHGFGVQLNGHGQEIMSTINPDYDTSAGFWLVIDVNSWKDKCQDLVHMLPEGGYAHTHVSLCNGKFAQPDVFYFNRNGVANPQNDYNASLGVWTVKRCDGKPTLAHDPFLPDHRNHFWYPRNTEDAQEMKPLKVHGMRFRLDGVCVANQ